MTFADLPLEIQIFVATVVVGVFIVGFLLGLILADRLKDWGRADERDGE
jgi:hypothetical protein